MLKPDRSATETSWNLEFSHVSCLANVLYKEIQRCWSDCADAHAGLRLCCSHASISGFFASGPKTLMSYSKKVIYECWVIIFNGKYQTKGNYLIFQVLSVYIWFEILYSLMYMMASSRHITLKRPSYRRRCDVDVMTSHRRRYDVGPTSKSTY